MITWKNGVVHRENVYELPSDTPGVAARMTVTPRLWGLLGSRVEAVDCQGEPLDAYQSFGGDLVARDPRTGLQTVLDLGDHSVVVSSPEVRQDRPSSQYIQRDETFSTCRQEVDGEGNMKFFIGIHGEREMTLPPVRSGSPPAILQDDHSWTQIELPFGGECSGFLVHQDKSGAVVRGPALESTVDREGRLAVTGEDGVTVSYEMYIHP